MRFLRDRFLLRGILITSFSNSGPRLFPRRSTSWTLLCPNRQAPTPRSLRALAAKLRSQVSPASVGSAGSCPHATQFPARNCALRSAIRARVPRGENRSHRERHGAKLRAEPHLPAPPSARDTFLQRAAQGRAPAPPIPNHWSAATALRWPCPAGLPAPAIPRPRRCSDIRSRVPFHPKRWSPRLAAFSASNTLSPPRESPVRPLQSCPSPATPAPPRSHAPRHSAGHAPLRSAPPLAPARRIPTSTGHAPVRRFEFFPTLQRGICILP